MEKAASRLRELGKLITHHTPTEGGTQTPLSNLILFRSCAGQPRQHEVYQAYLLILAQGEKRLHIGGQQYHYKAGDYLAVFMPMLLEAERVEVSSDEPYLMACIEVDLGRIANLLLKLDTLTPSLRRSESTNAAVCHMAPMRDHLLDPVIRLLQTLDNPRDIAILSESIVDEIYYRLLCDEQVGLGPFRRHLEQNGEIQQIARAVNHIQTNLDAIVSVDQLAHVSNMSTSGFHRTFKEVMHITPLQYAKALKLHRAQSLLHEGRTASEAGLSVGYNS
ncbi:MAG: AraC family transcriptional regulator, partial [Chloroflexi bacterium]|nr:AraC family transcriptional regulator [Chloroflexota bacterium]